MFTQQGPPIPARGRGPLLRCERRHTLERWPPRLRLSGSPQEKLEGFSAGIGHTQLLEDEEPITGELSAAFGSEALCTF